MSRRIQQGSTGHRARYEIYQDGVPQIGVPYNADGLSIFYDPIGGTRVAITLTSSNWFENGNGVYEATVQDSAYTGSLDLAFGGSLPGFNVIGETHEIVADAKLTATATAVWASATRTLTAISDSSGVTTLLSRITALLRTKAEDDATDVLILDDIESVQTAVDGLGDGIAAEVLAGLDSVSVTRLGPGFDPATGTITLIAGDDYVADNDTAITFSLTLPGVDLTGAIAVFSAQGAYLPVLMGTAELLETDTAEPKLRLSWTRAQTKLKPSPKYCWGAAIINAAGHVQTVIRGPLVLNDPAVTPSVVDAALPS